MDELPSTSANVRVATAHGLWDEDYLCLQPAPTCELQLGQRRRDAHLLLPSTSANVRVATAKMHKTLTMHGLLCAS